MSLGEKVMAAAIVLGLAIVLPLAALVGSRSDSHRLRAMESALGPGSVCRLDGECVRDGRRWRCVDGHTDVACALWTPPAEAPAQ